MQCPAVKGTVGESSVPLPGDTLRPHPTVVSSRRSLNHGEEEEKEETGLKTTEPLDPYAADHLRRNRGDRDRILHPQFGRMRRRKQSAKLFKAQI